MLGPTLLPGTTTNPTMQRDIGRAAAWNLQQPRMKPSELADCHRTHRRHPTARCQGTRSLHTQPRTESEQLHDRNPKVQLDIDTEEVTRLELNPTRRTGCAQPRQPDTVRRLHNEGLREFPRPRNGTRTPPAQPAELGLCETGSDRGLCSSALVRTLGAYTVRRATNGMVRLSMESLAEGAPTICGKNQRSTALCSQNSQIKGGST